MPRYAGTYQLPHIQRIDGRWYCGHVNADCRKAYHHRKGEEPHKKESSHAN